MYQLSRKEERALNARNLDLQERDALARWVADLRPWTHMATLTYRSRARSAHGTSATQLLESWHQRAQKKLDSPIAYFFCVEKSRAGTWHVHGLIDASESPASTARSVMHDAWFSMAGISTFAEVFDAEGAARYVLKDFTDETEIATCRQLGELRIGRGSATR